MLLFQNMSQVFFNNPRAVSNVRPVFYLLQNTRPTLCLFQNLTPAFLILNAKLTSESNSTDAGDPPFNTA